MVDLFQDDWLSNLIGLCSTPEQKNNLISSFICGWLEALRLMLSFFKGVQPFHPARNWTFLTSTETIFTPTGPSAPSWWSGIGSQSKPVETSKAFPLNPKSTPWLLAGKGTFLEKQKEKNVPWRVKLAFPHCGLSFPLSWNSHFPTPKYY